MHTSRETIGPVTVSIKTDGCCYVTAGAAPATATELRQLALLLLASADELDATT